MCACVEMECKPPAHCRFFGIAVRDRYSLMIVEDIYRVGSMVKESDETDDVFVERESPKLRKISSTKGSSTGGLRNWRSNFFSNKGGKKQKDEDSSSEAVDVLMQRLKLNVKEVAVSTEVSICSRTKVHAAVCFVHFLRTA